MVEKLKSLGKNQRFRLLLKSLIFLVVIEWFWGARSSGFLTPALIFAGIGLFLYLRPLWNGAMMLRSFVVFIGIVLMAGFLKGEFGNIWNVLYPFLATAVFYLIIGLKEYVLVHRRFWHFLIFSSLFYQTTFFYAIIEDAKSFPVWALVAPAVALFLIAGELVAAETKIGKSTSNLVAAIFAAIFIEALIIVKLLPIGFLNITNAVVLGGLFFIDLALYFYNGLLNKNILLTRLIFAIVLAPIIALTSRWYL